MRSICTFVTGEAVYSNEKRFILYCWVVGNNWGPVAKRGPVDRTRHKQSAPVAIGKVAGQSGMSLAAAARLLAVACLRGCVVFPVARCGVAPAFPWLTVSIPGCLFPGCAGVSRLLSFPGTSRLLPPGRAPVVSNLPVITGNQWQLTTANSN